MKIRRLCKEDYCSEDPKEKTCKAITLGIIFIFTVLEIILFANAV